MDGKPGSNELAALRELAAAGAARLRTASQWESWLRHAERFAYLGFTNTMLVWAQRPDAGVLHEYAGWKRLGRQVVRGEQGVKIISAAQPEHVTTLFDLAQTKGQAIVVRGTEQRYGGTHSGTWEALTRLAFRAGFAVTATRAVDAPTIRWESNTILATSGDPGSLRDRSRMCWCTATGSIVGSSASR